LTRSRNIVEIKDENEGFLAGFYRGCRLCYGSKIEKFLVDFNCIQTQLKVSNGTDSQSTFWSYWRCWSHQPKSWGEKLLLFWFLQDLNFPPDDRWKKWKVLESDSDEFVPQVSQWFQGLIVNSILFLFLSIAATSNFILGTLFGG
jgi:hypothetical protein